MALDQDPTEMAVYPLVAFCCYLRPLERLQVTSAKMRIACNAQKATITFMNTKTSGTKGPETVSLDNPAVIRWLKRFH